MITKGAKTFHFGLHKDVDKNLAHKIKCIINRTYCQNISMETILMNMGNSKTNESQICSQLVTDVTHVVL